MHLPLLTQRDCIDFALNLHCAVFTPKDIDSLVKLTFIDSQCGLIFLVFLQEIVIQVQNEENERSTTDNDPAFAVERKPGRFLTRQCLRFSGSCGLLTSYQTLSVDIQRPTWDSRVGGLVGLVTIPAVRRAGFLCVISLLSTLRNPLVTSSPRFSSAKTAAAPPALAVLDAGAAGAGGGGGGGGGPPAGEAEALYSATDMP